MKPQLSLQDLLIRKTAVQNNVPESIVDLVIAHKNKAVSEALYLHRSVEDSGLGKFSVRENRIRKRLLRIELIIETLENRLKVEESTEKIEKDLKSYLSEKEYLESKI